MSYTKITPAPAGLQAGELAVTLETGDMVAVSASCAIDTVSGNPVISASARVINADGTSKQVQGQTMTSYWSWKTSDVELANLGSGDSTAGMAILQKCCLMAVLGEPTDPMWTDQIHFVAMQDASIRTHILSSAHAGPVDPSTLL